MNRRTFLEQAIFSNDRRLLPHQIEQAIFAVEQKHSLNASETGTGRSLIALKNVSESSTAIISFSDPL